MSLFELSYLLLWVVVAFESLLLILVLRELGVLYLGRREAFERDGPKLGKLLPAIEASTADGSSRTLQDLKGDFRVLLYGGAECRLCGPVMEKLARWGGRIPELEHVMLIERTQDGSVSARLSKASWPVWFLSKGEIFERFGIRVSPYAILVDSTGVVLAKGLVNGHGDIKRLLRDARAATGETSVRGDSTATRPASAAEAI